MKKKTIGNKQNKNVDEWQNLQLKMSKGSSLAAHVLHFIRLYSRWIWLASQLVQINFDTISLSIYYTLIYVPMIFYNNHNLNILSGVWQLFEMLILSEIRWPIIHRRGKF
jgi:hypothetical protein